MIDQLATNAEKNSNDGKPKSLTVNRVYTKAGVHPYDEAEWERREVVQTNWKTGETVFQQREVEFPVFWDLNASTIVTTKYFRGALNTEGREWSLKQVIDRVVGKYVEAAIANNYMDEENAVIFEHELTWMLLHQVFSFNSPVWFNVGTKSPQQVSACQPYHSLVSTPQGLIPMGKLVEDNAVGTQVYDVNGITTILAVKNNGEKEVLRITTKDGRQLDVTPDHLVWKVTLGNRSHGTFVAAGNLKAGDMLYRCERGDPSKENNEILEIASIESLGIMEVYDIQTESEEYLSENIRVHNCFILAVEDNMDSILNWYREEGLIFKGGSGAGLNLSKIRGSKEHLRTSGGIASGPVSFMRAADASAGAIKSAGACLAPWTLVYTETGPKTVKDLAESEKDFIAMSYNPILGRVQATNARAWLSGEKQLVKLVTDKGEFTLSYDHPVMLLSGGYKAVGELTEGMSIRPANITVNDLGYQRVGLQGGAKEKESVHRLIAQDILKIEIKDLEVHHKDRNPRNNSERNLLPLTRTEHVSLHAREDMESGIHPFIQFGGQGNHPAIAGDKNGMSFASGNRTPEYSLARDKGMRANGVYELGQDAAARQRMINMAYKVVNESGHSIDTFEEYFQGRLLLAGKMGYSKAKQLQKIEERFGTYDFFLEEVRAGNHKVVSIQPLTVSPVYDVEVDNDTPRDKSDKDGHNFMIVSETNNQKGYTGIFVSNTRRAAKMVILDVDHPDIEEFIETKASEERKIRALRDAGFDMDLSGKDISSVQYQNANNSVRVSDKFLKAVEDGTSFDLLARLDGSVIETIEARALWKKIAQAAWECADPGIQYDDNINHWHTNSNSGKINGSNPCFPADQRVVTNKGLIRIGDLISRAGKGEDFKVYTNDITNEGKSENKILATIPTRYMENGVKEVLELKFSDGSRIRCTPNHRLWTTNGWVQAEDLTKEDKVVKSINIIDRSEITPATSLLEEDMKEFLSTIVANAPYGAEIHEAIFQAPQASIVYFLQRVYDLDGSVVDGESEGYSCYINLLNHAEEFLLGIQELLASLGIHGSVYTSQDEVDMPYSTDGLSREFRLYDQNIVKFKELIGFTLLTKAVVLEHIVSEHKFYEVNENITLRNRISIGKEMTYNLTEPRNHSYIVSGIVVANCSEYLSLDNSSCNLASLNLMKFQKNDGTFDAELFVKATELVITAMEISISFADFPTEAITKNTHDFRQLGIGYANLGALLMSSGLAYDSAEGRAYAAAITSLMTGVSYRRSAEIAGIVGAYAGYSKNKKPHTRVMEQHREAAKNLVEVFEGKQENFIAEDIVSGTKVASPIASLALEEWNLGLELGKENGWRNAQASVLAPTGTISFMLGCDTTGVEPDFALIKSKKLVGGSSMQIINNQVDPALRSLGYQNETIEAIEAFIAEHGHVVNAPGLKPEHYSVFDCAVGERAISPNGHIRMMAAIQPFVSGAISKTVNLPESATVEEIEKTYFDGWKLGLKAIAVYRDNCKVGQPLSDGKAKKASVQVEESEQAVKIIERIIEKPARRRLPSKRTAETTSFVVAGAEGYLTAGLYDDGKVGEVFVKMSKQGSTLAGIMDALSICISMGLQYGVPLEAFVAKFMNMRFEPSGMTEDEDVRMAQSLLDYIARRIALDHLPLEVREQYGIYTAKERIAALDGEQSYEKISQDEILIEPKVRPADSKTGPESLILSAPGTNKDSLTLVNNQEDHLDRIRNRDNDAPLCTLCGIRMVYTGACAACRSCGSTSGCS